MKIAVIGATGNIGSKIMAEALERGHDVTAIARDTSKLPGHPRLSPQKGDAADSAALASIVHGHEAVISSLPFPNVDPATLCAALKKAGVKRLLVVGGAGSLNAPGGHGQLVDQPDFPAAWKDIALKGRDFLNHLKTEPTLEWTFLSPSAMIAPGERTGTFRTGKDDLLVDAAGNSHISQEDYAIAMLDEVEEPRHIRARFTVGY